MEAPETILSMAQLGRTISEGNDGNDELFGEADNDILVGQQGNDRLDGGTGVDRMIGGVGDDIYIVDSSGDNVVEFENGGRDQVLASANFSLGTHVENLILTGTEILQEQATIWTTES